MCDIGTIERNQLAGAGIKKNFFSDLRDFIQNYSIKKPPKYFGGFVYWNIHGAKKVRMYRNIKRITSPIITLNAQFLRVDFIFTSSPPAQAHAIPSQTIASTPRIITIKTIVRTISANMDSNPARPRGTRHIYFRVLIFSHAASHMVGHD